MNLKTQKITIIGMFIILLICLFAIGNNTSGGKKAEAAELELPVVGSVEKLQELLEEWQTNANIPYPIFGARNIAITSAADAAAPALETQGVSETYSGTNVQVQGVDEADLVKTDGEYIYKVSHTSLQIIQAVPADQMKQVSNIPFDEKEFTPRELYIDEKRLVLIGEYWESLTQDWLTWNHFGMRILLYDVSDIEQPRLMRQEDVPGEYISTRKVGDYLYFALSQNIDWNGLENQENYLPTYQEQTFGTLGETTQKYEIPLTEVCYFPDCVQPQYLLLGAMHIQDLKQPAQIRTYLGDGSSLYANQEHMYVALTDWQYQTADDSQEKWQTPESKTHIYRFAMKGIRIVCDGKGEVPGQIINQFAMDEYEGYFRIATTTGSVWGEGEDTSKNNLYILDDDLHQIGALTDMAPGEQIYSVRFMGEKAYMVTFRTVDPLFVLDVSQPEQPAILGQLKIPGYSDYLHPYDENHIIGFGKETIEVKNGDSEPSAYYLGMKVALFDVTDVTHPVEISKVTIGDRGTESELLHDHKALLFDRNKQLLAFPVTVMSLNGQPIINEEYSYKYPNYGDFSYQGAYIYHLDVENGFDLRGRITHLSEEDYQKAGDGWYDSSLNIRRILYIGDQLYTISDEVIQANQLTTLQETGRLHVTIEE